MRRSLTLLGFCMVLVGGCQVNPRPLPPGPPIWSGVVPPPTKDFPELSKTPLILADVLTVALQRNAGLRAAEFRWNAARLIPDQVSSLPDPSITINRFVDEIATRNGAIEWQVMLQQKFPFPGKLGLRSGMAEQQALMAWERYMLAGVNLIAEVKQAYYEFYWIQQSVRITGENKSLLEQVLEVAQTKYKAGQVTQQDVLKAQMELAKLTEDLNTLHDLERTVRLRLNRVLNRTEKSVLGNPEMLVVSKFEKDVDGIYHTALKSRPELREANLAITRAEYGEQLAKREYFPDFVVTGGYSLIEDTDLAGAPDPGQDAWSVGFGITLPIWWGKRNAAVRESQEQLKAARLTRIQLEHDTRYELASLYYRLQIAFRQVKLYKDTLVPQARQALTVSQTGYTAVPPKVDFESVINNQRRLLNFQLALERSQADFQQRMADLERIVGSSISEIEK